MCPTRYLQCWLPSSKERLSAEEARQWKDGHTIPWVICVITKKLGKGPYALKLVTDHIWPVSSVDGAHLKPYHMPPPVEHDNISGSSQVCLTLRWSSVIVLCLVTLYWTALISHGIVISVIDIHSCRFNAQAQMNLYIMPPLSQFLLPKVVPTQDQCWQGDHLWSGPHLANKNFRYIVALMRSLITICIIYTYPEKPSDALVHHTSNSLQHCCHKIAPQPTGTNMLSPMLFFLTCCTVDIMSASWMQCWV